MITVSVQRSHNYHHR